MLHTQWKKGRKIALCVLIFIILGLIVSACDDTPFITFHPEDRRLLLSGAEFDLLGVYVFGSEEERHWILAVEHSGDSGTMHLVPLDGSEGCSAPNVSAVTSADSTTLISHNTIQASENGRFIVYEQLQQSPDWPTDYGPIRIVDRNCVDVSPRLDENIWTTISNGFGHYVAVSISGDVFSESHDHEWVRIGHTPLNLGVLPWFDNDGTLWLLNDQDSLIGFTPGTGETYQCGQDVIYFTANDTENSVYFSDADGLFRFSGSTPCELERISDQSCRVQSLNLHGKDGLGIVRGCKEDDSETLFWRDETTGEEGELLQGVNLDWIDHWADDGIIFFVSTNGHDSMELIPMTREGMLEGIDNISWYEFNYGESTLIVERGNEIGRVGLDGTYETLVQGFTAHDLPSYWNSQVVFEGSADASPLANISLLNVVSGVSTHISNDVYRSGPVKFIWYHQMLGYLREPDLEGNTGRLEIRDLLQDQTHVVLDNVIDFQEISMHKLLGLVVVVSGENSELWFIPASHN